MKSPSLITLFFVCIFSIITGCQKESDVNQVPIAKAGNSRTVTLPKDTIVLHGSGEDLDGQVKGYLWSKISGPNTPIIHNNGSDSAVIEGFVSGIYLFQFMVIDNMGATGIDTVRITVLPSASVTVSLQPSNNLNEVHIWGNSTNLEGSTVLQIDEMGVAYWTYGGTEVGMRAAFKFDMSTIPANATITSAKLSLYSHPNPVNGDHIAPNSGSNNAMVIQRITSPWVATSVKWISQPTATTSLQVVIPSTSQPTLDLVDVDVKDLVSAMVTVNNNHGFFIKLQTESLYNSRIFCTSKYANSAKRPKLQVVYQVK